MTGLLVLFAFPQWHSVVVDTPNSHGELCLLLDRNGYPVMITTGGNEGDTFKVIRWTGTGWESKFGNVSSHDPAGDFRSALDSKGYVWKAGVPNQYFAYVVHETATGWDTITFQDTLFEYSWGFTVDTLDVPHLFYSKFNTLICHAFYQDTAWVRETIGLADLFEMPLYGMSAMGPNNDPHYVYMSVRNLVHFWKEDGTWREDTVEKLGMDADFAWSSPYIYVDWRDWPHCLYNPWYDSCSCYIMKYAYRDILGWHREFAKGLGRYTINLSLVVDSSCVIHTAKGSPFGVYHLCRYPGDTLWHTEERIDTFSETGYFRIAMDSQGYLHLAFGANTRTSKVIVYATTNPEIGISESPPEPKPGLVLIPSSHGFYITGYSGLARIYDPAGRLVLSKEIKGKTLISPLKPGVYFVVAGRQRERVAIR